MKFDKFCLNFTSKCFFSYKIHTLQNFLFGQYVDLLKVFALIFACNGIPSENQNYFTILGHYLNEQTNPKMAIVALSKQTGFDQDSVI